MAIDPSFEFEKRRNIPVKYDRQLWTKTVDAMKKIETIRQRRQNNYIMQRLRKGREQEILRDVKEVSFKYLLKFQIVQETKLIWRNIMMMIFECQCNLMFF